MRFLFGLALCAALAACGGGGDPAAPDVPAVVTITPNGAATLASGAGLQLSATYRDTKGRVVNNPSITWTTADASVATVAQSGLVVGVRTGTADITATSAGASSSVTVTVTPGAAVKLVVTTQPAGAASGVLLTTQPVVEVRDNADNLVTTGSVLVAVGVSGGTVTGTTSLTAQQGVARFTDLTVRGTIGSRTLVFTSGALASAASNSFDLSAGPAVAIGYRGTPPRLRSGIAGGASGVAAQLLDSEGNDAALSGRAVTVAVSGGAGTTNVSGTAAVTNAQGRALFSALTVTGVAGARTLTFRADNITNPATATLTLLGGAPQRVVVERDVPLTVESNTIVSPAPIVRLVDSVGNASPESGVTIRATSSGATLASATAVTDTLGRATFSGLSFISGTGARTVQFAATGLAEVTSRSIEVTPPDVSPQPTSILTAASDADTAVRNIELGTTTSVRTPFLLARDAQGQAMATTGVRWVSRDPTRATVAADGRITGAQPGRTFVVAQASRNAGIADSVLVFVPRSGTGPIVRATLPSYRVRTDTFSITIEIVPRDGRTLSAADMEIAWPGSRAGVFSPFNVTGFSTLAANVQTQFVDAQQSLRLTWASTAPVSGAVQLIRLRCTVNQRGQGNQVVITLNQLLQGDLSDITAVTSVFNPVVVIP
ncbi:Ig-like domain-containing protein [Gemmatimonas phototrophica]|uniref:BIG2 domain-containing protein n=1 Tax=Gemmatimonas phototrophica TaxID=1379270 RepID=A0A143BHU0_9BACT|nr:Ig-like domain-containing protein [Gemmatimonas phototrophica]AMW04173.1 hypothetical protein GEMMAAP_03650 [Gemmatimonas phototrophica]